MQNLFLKEMYKQLIYSGDILKLYISVAEPKLFIFGPAPTLSIISASAPTSATATYFHLKLFYNSSTVLYLKR